MCSNFVFLGRFLFELSCKNTHTHTGSNEYPIVAFSKNATIIIKNGKVLTTHSDIVNGFNKYFTIKGPDLSKNIPKCKDYNEKIHETSMLNSVFMDDVSENEILNMVNLFKSKTSFGYDGIIMQIVKYIIKVIAKPLAHKTTFHSKVEFLQTIQNQQR